MGNAVEGAKLPSFEDSDMFLRTYRDSHGAESEPSRTWGQGSVERGHRLTPERIPKRKGAVFPEVAAGRAVPRLCSRGQGAPGEGGGPSHRSGLLFGQSEVPGSFLCTLPHGLHEAGEAHVFGLLQASH